MEAHGQYKMHAEIEPTHTSTCMFSLIVCAAKQLNVKKLKIGGFCFFKDEQKGKKKKPGKVDDKKKGKEKKKKEKEKKKKKKKKGVSMNTTN